MKLFHRCLIGIILIIPIFSQELNITTLESLIIQGNSSLKVRETEIERKSELLNQSRLFSNPEIEIESGMRNTSETSGKITQTIVTGGKRKHNIRLHDLELSKSKIEYEMQKRTILNEARVVFVNIVQLQEKKKLQNKRIEISESLLKVVENKVIAGKLSPAEKSRAKIQLFQEHTALRKIEASLKIAWITLSTFWENENVKFDFALGDITKYSSFSNKINLTNSPDFHLSEIMIEIQKATLQLEKANAIPNFDLDAGISGGSQYKTYSLGLSIPLPLFNRNKGNIQNAKIMQSQKLFAQNVLQTELKTKVSNIHIELEELHTEINLLLNEIIPEANSAFTIIQDGYFNGRYTYLDVVNMREIWFQSREQYLSALSDYHISFLEMNSILGNNINKTTLLGDN